LLENRDSMCFALFALCAVLPIFCLVAAARGVHEPWRAAVRVRRGRAA
jgi:hypothetical protein